jgi:preprotein translocase subunit SecF
MNVREGIATFRGHRVPHIDFMGKKRWWFAISGAAIVASLIGLIFIGLNFSIAFKGGALLQYPNRSGATVPQIESVLSKYGRGGPDSTVEILGSNQVNIRTGSLTDLGLRADQLRADLARQAGINSNEINEQDVGPTWGSTISRKALLGLVVFLILVSGYISLRFEPKMAASALVALGHDLIITAGVYALVGREVTPETVIAILTILGYSLYDTVVIFDKIKENTESPALVARETYSGVVNISLNQTLMRSVNTSLVVLLPIGSLLLFGGQTLKDFAFALFIGVASGTYSSIFVASPVLALLKEREPRYQQIRARAEVRTARPGLRSVPAGEAAPAVASTRQGLQPTADGTTALAVEGAPGNGASAARSRQTAATRSGTGSSSARKKRRKPQGKPKPRRR